MNKPLAATLALLALPLSLAAQGPGPRLISALIDSAGNRVGQVTASEDAGGALLQVLVSGLTPGLHGMHLHAGAKCEPPAFTTAQGHFNPTARKHGHKNPEGAHVGDLPNLTVLADGTGRAQLHVDGWLLRAGEKSVGAPGTALVIHAGPDDDATDPSGNSGARIACAVISVAPAE